MRGGLEKEGDNEKGEEEGDDDERRTGEGG